MSFVYRPTPVVTLGGKTVGSDHVPLRGLPAGTMHGYVPNRASPALNAIGRRTISGSPWLLRSGTMNGFLGQDDGLDPGIIDISPIDTGSDLVPPTFDYGSAFASPLVPAPSMLPPNLTAPVAPDIGSPVFNPGTLFPIAAPPPPAPVISSAGSATRPPAAAPVQAAVASGGASILSTIANFFKPTVSPTPMTAAQPGVYKATTITPSFFAQSTLLPGIPNSTALLGGVVVLVLFGVLTGGKKR